RPAVGPARLDDRVGAGRAQSFDDIAGRLVGNDGEGTLQRHWAWVWARRLAEAADSSVNPAKVLLTGRQFYLCPPCALAPSPRVRGEGAKAFVKVHCRAWPGSRHQLSGRKPNRDVRAGWLIAARRATHCSGR